MGGLNDPTLSLHRPTLQPRTQARTKQACLSRRGTRWRGGASRRSRTRRKSGSPRRTARTMNSFRCRSQLSLRAASPRRARQSARRVAVATATLVGDRRVTGGDRRETGGDMQETGGDRRETCAAAFSQHAALKADHHALAKTRKAFHAQVPQTIKRRAAGCQRCRQGVGRRV